MSMKGKPAGEFLIGRLTRIMPGLLVFATLAFLVLSILSNLPVSELFWRWLRAVFLFPKGPWIDGAIWTLTVEIVFYTLMFVVLAFRIQRHLGRMVRIFTIMSAIFWSMVFIDTVLPTGLPMVDMASIASIYALKTFLVTTGSFFALGYFLYEYHDGEKGAHLNAYTAISTAACFYAVYIFADSSVGVVEYGQNPWVPAIIWALCILGCFVVVGFEGYVKMSDFHKQVIRQMGLLTYPVYLINQITGSAIAMLLFRVGFSEMYSLIITIVLIVFISWLFSNFWEPVIRKKLDSLFRWASMRSLPT